MPQLKIYQNTREVHTIPGVLPPVTMTAGATTSGSNLITVASTSDVYPGMPVACPHVPAGAFVAAVVSSTVLELALADHDFALPKSRVRQTATAPDAAFVQAATAAAEFIRSQQAV